MNGFTLWIIYISTLLLTLFIFYICSLNDQSIFTAFVISAIIIFICVGFVDEDTPDYFLISILILIMSFIPILLLIDMVPLKTIKIPLL